MNTRILIPLIAAFAILPSCGDSSSKPAKKAPTEQQSSQHKEKVKKSKKGKKKNKNGANNISPAQRQQALDKLVSRGVVTSAADLEKKSGEDGYTPLLQAAASGDVGLLELLVTAGGDLRARDQYGQTAMHLAAKNNNPAAVKYLAKAGAEVDSRDSTEWTPLIQSAQKGKTAIVKALLGAGADPRATNKGGRSALQLAASNGHADTVRALLEKGADVNQASLDHETPLMAAAQNGHPDVIRILLDAGADPDLRSLCGYTAMDSAIHSLKLDSVQALGGDENTRISKLMPMTGGKKPTRRQALDFLVKNGYLKNEAQLNERFLYGGTILSYAASKGAVQMIRLLIIAGANVNLKSESGMSPLGNALLFDEEYAAQELRRAGATK